MREVLQMARLYVVIPDELERELRKVVPNRKGALGQFVSEAIKEKLERMKKEGLI